MPIMFLTRSGLRTWEGKEQLEYDYGNLPTSRVRKLGENSHLRSEDTAQNGGMLHKNLAVQSHTAWH